MNVVFRVVPLVMRRNISCPKNSVWFNLSLYVVTHHVEELRRDVTPVVSIWTSLVLRINRESFFCSAAEDVVTVDCRPNSVH